MIEYFRLPGHLRKVFQFGHQSLRFVTAPHEKARRRAKHSMYQRMVQDKGLFLKIGQFMNREGQFGEVLDAKAPQFEAMPFEQVKALLDQQLPEGSQTFDKIESTPFVASLGQVHRAYLHDGKAVAIKIQFPRIRKDIESQLKVLGMLPRLGPAKKWGIPLGSYKQMFWHGFQRELDYTLEAQNQIRYAENVRHLKKVSVPYVFSEWSTNTVLVQEWAQGLSYPEARVRCSAEEKQDYARTLAEHLVCQFFIHGFVQLDIHPGNYIFGEGRISLVDFGDCYQFSDKFRLSLLRLLIACYHQQDEDPLPMLVAMGFDESKLAPIHHNLPQVVQKLFEPFLIDRPFDLKSWCLEDSMEKILGELKWWFRASGSLDFFRLMKAASGLFSLVGGFGGTLNWNAIWRKATLGQLPQALALSFPKADLGRYTFQALAQKLHVSVWEGAKEKVHLTLPARSLVDLEGYMDQDLKRKIAKKGVGLREIIDEAVAQGSYPQVLFDLTDEDKKQYRVWLD